MVDVVIDINLFKLSFEASFPKSKKVIKENKDIFDRLNFSLMVFNRVLSKKELIDCEFETALNGIDLGFQSLLFDMKYGCIIKIE